MASHFRKSTSRLLPLLLLALAARGAAARPKVVVLGFDGADYRLVAKGIADGTLPNLAALAHEGGFVPLRPTVPAQTPVSWSTFSTGVSPGRTQIFDFLKRDPKSYRPEFAIAEEGSKPCLLGATNPFAAAALAGLLAFGIGALVLRAFRARGKLLLGGAALLLAAGAVFGWREGRLLPRSVPTV